MLRDLSFRPRPIDVNRPIPIFHNLPELEEREYGASGTSSRSVPQMPTGMEAEEEEEAHIQEAIKRSLKAFSAKEESLIDIPTPRVIVVDGWDEFTPEDYLRTSTYVRWSDPYIQFPPPIEYDMEPEDEELMHKVEEKGYELTAEELESSIDRLERESDSRHESNCVSMEECMGILSEKGNINSIVIEMIYGHWVKRREEERMPLIYRYLRPPDPEDRSPFRAFRVRVEEKLKKKTSRNDNNTLIKMRQLRQEMERARTLLEMIKKRERMKKELVEYLEYQYNMEMKMIETSPVEVSNKRKKMSMIIREAGYISPEEGSDQDQSGDESSEEDETQPISFPTSSHPYTSAIFPFSTVMGVTWNEIKINNTIDNTINKTINNTRNVSINRFRGRARMGRGGRLLFDTLNRYHSVHQHPNNNRLNNKPNGIPLSLWDIDEGDDARIGSLFSLYRYRDPVVASSSTDASLLLRTLHAINRKRGRDPDSNIQD